jgi:DNA-directed RNA polymerase specialized sigma24 family protein
MGLREPGADRNGAADIVAAAAIMTEQVTDTAGMARAIYRRMPNVGRFMDYDDIRQECELRRIEGRARCFAQLYRHIIDLARHFGGRDGRYATDELSDRFPVLTAPAVERGILLAQLTRCLTRQQERVIEACLIGQTPEEAASTLGLRPKSVTQYKHAAMCRMRRAAGRAS